MSLRFRPFAIIGFTSLSVLLLCVYFSEIFGVISAAVGFLLLICSLAFKCIRDKIIPFYIASALMFSGLMFTAINDYDVKYARSFVGSDVVVNGILTDAPSYSNSRYYYVLDLDYVNGHKVNTKIRVSLPNAIDADPYDKLKLPVKLYDIAAENRDVQLYYHSKGIFLGGYADKEGDYNVEVVKRETTSLSYKLFCVKEEITRRIFEKLPNENGATVIAILLGDKDNLPEESNDKFKEVGIAPVFAVSGLHLSVWVMGLYGLLNQIGIKKRLNSIIGIVFTFLFMLLTGLTPSVCRSGLMMLLLLSGNLFYRKTDSLNSLGFAAFVLCAFNPLIVADVGFLLSFSATLGIVMLMPLISKNILCRFEGNSLLLVLKNLLNLIFVSVSASIGVLPVTVFFIGYLSVFTILSNLLITYVATICMILGGFVAITYRVEFLSDILAVVTGLCSKFIIRIVDIIYDFSLTTISTQNIFWKIGVIISLGVVFFSLVCFKKKALFKSIAVGLTFVITISCVSSLLYYDDLTQIRILNVGNGVSAVIYRNGRKLVLTGEADGYYKVSEIIDNLDYFSMSEADLLLLADSDANADSADLELILKYGFNQIVIPRADNSVNAVSDSSEIIVSADVDINTWENGLIKFVSCDEYSLAVCTFENIKYLFLFDSKKYVKIEPEYLDADYLICSGYIPNCISPEKYKRIFLCGSDIIENPIAEYVNSSGGNPVKVYEYESVRINVRNQKDKVFVMEG